MTNNPGILPAAPESRLVLFTAYPSVGLLDITGPQTVFWAATVAMEKRGHPGYVLKTVSLQGGLHNTVEGLQLHTLPVAEFADATVHTLIVPGSPHIERVLDDSGPLLDWIRTASARAYRTASVCTGTFFLAKAGLLTDRRAATHWGMCDLLRERFPHLEVDRDAIFVREGSVWTSAGVSAGIDLALALVEEDCGREVAMEVARELVVFLKRPGGQAQFSVPLQSQSHERSPFHDLHAWITDNLAQPELTVDLLAEKACMSPRNFARVYKQKTGRTPAKAVELFRLEAARRQLEDTASNVNEIATLCGFGDEERMRLTFKRHLGVVPRDYRKRFSR